MLPEQPKPQVSSSSSELDLSLIEVNVKHQAKYLSSLDIKKEEYKEDIKKQVRSKSVLYKFQSKLLNRQSSKS